MQKWFYEPPCLCVFFLFHCIATSQDSTASEEITSFPHTCTAIPYTALNFTVNHCKALHSTNCMHYMHCMCYIYYMYCMYCTELHCTELHCTELHCTAPH